MSDGKTPTPRNEFDESRVIVATSPRQEQPVESDKYRDGACDVIFFSLPSTVSSEGLKKKKENGVTFHNKKEASGRQAWSSASPFLFSPVSLSLPPIPSTTLENCHRVWWRASSCGLQCARRREGKGQWDEGMQAFGLQRNRRGNTVISPESVSQGGQPMPSRRRPGEPGGRILSGRWLDATGIP